MRYPKVKAPTIAWERAETLRGQPFSLDEMRFLEDFSKITEAMRYTARLRDRFLLAVLEGKNPKVLRRLARKAVNSAEVVNVMRAMESADPELWHQLQGETR